MFWYGHENGINGWGWAGMTLGMLLFWAVVIGAGVVLFRALSTSSANGGHRGRTTDPRPPEVRPTAEQLLAERFVRGEIDEDEYRRRLATLRNPPRDLD
ncbi:SHOCT domain-containing protein [Phaeacidiphilus oryzae]|jgi:putative membrane protein|uniref:SHOCT domain-containing protein n=1 Tax=Phaeacidiphilus oryzae TaxID=348818 RepID=UPI00056540C7|nr:SHOCT domain-containing protein [Phaeacidiphilus oryzae]